MSAPLLAAIALTLVACNGSEHAPRPQPTALNSGGAAGSHPGSSQSPQMQRQEILTGGAPITSQSPRPPRPLEGGRQDRFGLQFRPQLEELAFPTDGASPQPLGATRRFAGLTLVRPVQLTNAPDAARDLYVVEQAGRIVVFNNDDTVTGYSTFLDIRSQVNHSSGEEGLFSVAFDPDFGTSNGTFWLSYTAGSPRRSVISRFEATFPPGSHPVADPKTEVVVLESPQRYANHNGGAMAFGPDDMLYIGLGDGGGSHDQLDNSQNLASPLGAILRLDVRGQTTYAVPKDNPFVGTAGAREEIWAYGIRNPWRMSFDRETGELWLGDVGQDEREEISLIQRGGNYGWPIYEGHRSNRNPNGLPASAFEAPVHDYNQQLGRCVIGGIVVRGNALPSLSGAYLYGDYSSGTIWALVRDDSKVVSNTVVQNISRVVSFAEDDDGTVYAVSISGSIWRLDEGSNPPASTLPGQLSETGLFSDVAALLPNPGLIEYEVNTPLWTDGAEKRRWMGIPNDAQIEVADDGTWTYPVGTVLVKHFAMDLDPQGQPDIRPLETRVILRVENGWRAFTYRWNTAGTDADLLLDRASELLTIKDPAASGGVRTQRYDYPSRTDCRRCHDDSVGFVLGLSPRQLNLEFSFTDARDNQLRTWNHIGLFDRDLGAEVDIPAVLDPRHPSATIEQRARLYLDANCAFCHNPDGTAPGSMDMRFETAEAQMSLIDVRPSEGDLGITDAWRVLPGSPTQSVLWERMQRLDSTRMPPLGSHAVDEEAAELLRLWIQSR